MRVTFWFVIYFIFIYLYIYNFIYFGGGGVVGFGGKASTDGIVLQRVPVMHQLYGCQPPFKKEEEEEEEGSKHSIIVAEENPCLCFSPTCYVSHVDSEGPRGEASPP